MTIDEVADERAHVDAELERADVAEDRNTKLTTRVSVLEDS